MFKGQLRQQNKMVWIIVVTVQDDELLFTF